MHLFRISGLAGTKITDHSLFGRHCDTSSPGWIDGTHPSNLNETVSRKVCFSYGDSDVCMLPVTNMEIKNCGKFYLYNLKDVPQCKMRYCTE